MGYNGAPYPPNQNAEQEARERSALAEIHASVQRARWYANELDTMGVSWWQIAPLIGVTEDVRSLAADLTDLCVEQAASNATPEQLRKEGPEDHDSDE